MKDCIFHTVTVMRTTKKRISFFGHLVDNGAASQNELTWKECAQHTQEYLVSPYPAALRRCAIPELRDV